MTRQLTTVIETCPKRIGNVGLVHMPFRHGKLFFETRHSLDLHALFMFSRSLRRLSTMPPPKQPIIAVIGSTGTGKSDVHQHSSNTFTRLLHMHTTLTTPAS